MGSNPSRTIGNRSYHDQMITVVACNLETSGYFVQADHVGWRNGASPSVNGHTPDIMAIKGNQHLILEVEDCVTCSDQNTRDQLTAFGQICGCQVYVVVPSVCIGPDSNESSVEPICCLAWASGSSPQGESSLAAIPFQEPLPTDLYVSKWIYVAPAEE